MRLSGKLFYGSVPVRYIALISLAAAVPATAQQRGVGELVRLDSVIYTNPVPAPPYPFEARRDSLRTRLEADCDSASAATDESWVPECHWPTYFFEPPFDARLAGVDGGWPEAQAALEQALPPGFLAFVTVEVAWDGSVQEARLRGYRGELEDVNVVALVRRLRFDLSGSFGFPTLERAPFGVPLRGAPAREAGDP